MHALNLRKHTPPLARFLTELSRAQCAQVTTSTGARPRRCRFFRVHLQSRIS